MSVGRKGNPCWATLMQEMGEQVLKTAHKGIQECHIAAKVSSFAHCHNITRAYKSSSVNAFVEALCNHNNGVRSKRYSKTQDNKCY